jgi:hypothetical protein
VKFGLGARDAELLEEFGEVLVCEARQIRGLTVRGLAKRGEVCDACHCFWIQL